MTISGLFSLLGGLGLFLYGMDMLCSSLSLVMQGRMSEAMERLTATDLRGFLTGLVVTAILQSSSAVTVVLVGLVDAGALSLRRTVGVILGANIGTTVTGQLTAFRMNDAAFLLAFLGSVLVLFCHGERKKRWGSVIAGAGFLFTGLAMMEEAMLPLGAEPWVKKLFAACSHPMWGIWTGALFTAVIQSSSAAVSMLQVLVRCGLVASADSMYIICGQNMGSCVTALLASMRADIWAKRTAMLHFLINVLGSAAFFVIWRFLPAAEWIGKLTPGNPARQIANMHTIFNVVTSVLLLPFSGGLVRIVENIIPLRKE